MKPDFPKLIIEHNEHTLFLNKERMVNAMEIVYELGKQDGNQEVLEWLSNMDYLSDNIQYIKEEWKNQKS